MTVPIPQPSTMPPPPPDPRASSTFSLSLLPCPRFYLGDPISWSPVGKPGRGFASSLEKEPHDEHITRLLTCCDWLREAESSKCRLIDGRCDRQSVVSLVGRDGFSRHWPKNTIDRSIVVTCAR